MSPRRRRALGAEWILLALAMSAAPGAAQTSPEVDALLTEAADIVARSDAGPAGLRQAGYAEAARLLDEIVQKHPDTDAAVDIMLGQAVGPVDPAAIRAIADGAPLAAPVISRPLPDGAAAPWSDAAATEAALDLTRAQRREVQIRLALLGFDPRGIDGLFGPDTRAAIAQWQRARCAAFRPSRRCAARRAAATVRRRLWALGGAQDRRAAPGRAPEP